MASGETPSDPSSSSETNTLLVDYSSMTEPQLPSYSEATIPAQATTVAAASGQSQPDVDGQPPSGVAQPQPIAVFWQIGPNGQPQMLYGHSPSAGMQPLVQPASQAVPYIPLQPTVQPVTATLPPSLQPYSFLALSLAITIICALVNITSLVFGIPALVLSMQDKAFWDQCSRYCFSASLSCYLVVSGQILLSLLTATIMSEEQKHAHQYESAKKSGAIALALNLINMMYLLITITVALAVPLGVL